MQTAQTIGMALRRDYGIEDPVLRVKTKLAETLARQATLSNIRPVTATMQSEDPSALKRPCTEVAGHPGRALAPILGVRPVSVYAAARLGLAERGRWDALIGHM